MPRHQKVKEIGNGLQVLLDGRDADRPPQLFDVQGNMHRIDLLKRKAPQLAPQTKLLNGAEVGHACVGIADVGGEEFDEANCARGPALTMTAGRCSRPATSSIFCGLGMSAVSIVSE
jgi:hypothetical protein